MPIRASEVSFCREIIQKYKYLEKIADKSLNSKHRNVVKNPPMVAWADRLIYTTTRYSLSYSSSTSLGLS